MIEKENNKSQILLKKYTKNLNEAYKKGEEIDVIGRDKEIREVVDVLSKLISNNPILIGHPGVGKTAVVKGLVQNIEKGQVPQYLLKKKILQLDIMALISGTKFHGDLEERLKIILDYISNPDNNSILFIDEIHSITGFGRLSHSGGTDISNLLKPMLTKGDIQCIGSTTIEEYYQYIEKDGALSRRFSTIYVREPTVEETYNILLGVIPYFEKYCNLRIMEQSIKLIINFSNRYLTDKFFPDKAISLLDEVCAKIKSSMWYEPKQIQDSKEYLKELKEKYLSISSYKNDEDKERKNENKLLILSLQHNIKEAEEKIKYLEQQNEKEKKNIEDLEKKRNRILISENLFKHYQENYHENNKEIKEKIFNIWYKEIPKLREEENVLEEKVKKNIMRNYYVDVEQVAEIIEKKYGIKAEKILLDEKKRLQDLFLIMKDRIKGQDKALFTVYNAVIRSRLGVQNPKIPLASFFFVGPTGVGKTELAIVLSEQLFGTSDHLLRFDMTEFSEPHSVSKLLGSPPGYIGFEQMSLFEKIKERINNIIVFDEIEKCHSEVVNLLLQVLDNGFLRLSNGKEINFRNSIIIFTSNIAYDLYFEFSGDELEKKINQTIKGKFRPEFLNRLTEIVCFNKLEKDIIRDIIKKELDDFIDRMKKDKNIKLECEYDSVVEKILKESYSSEYGARAIRRYIENNLGTLIAKGIIYNVIRQNEKIWIYAEKETGKFRITNFHFLNKTS